MCLSIGYIQVYGLAKAGCKKVPLVLKPTMYLWRMNRSSRNHNPPLLVALQVACLVAILSAPVNVSAQQINFGPTFGTVASNFRGDKDFNGIRRYYGGGMANLNILRYGMCLQAEALIVAAGARRADFGPVTNYRLHASYVTLPLLVKMRLRQRFHVGVGYQLALLLGANERYDFLGNERELDATPRFSSNDAGLLIDIGYQTLWGLGVHVRYYRGAHRISLDKGPELYNHWIQGGVFFAFGEKPEPIRWRRPIN